MYRNSPPKYTKLVTLFLLIAGLSLSHAASSQKLITGTVTSDSVTVIAGVKIEVQGSTVTTLTDRYGQYSIAAGTDATLIFKRDGYTTQEVFVNGRTVIDVVMPKSADFKAELVH